MTFENGGAAASPSRNFVFQGSGAGYFWIWLVNVLLTIVTFGLFLPWALLCCISSFWLTWRIITLGYPFV